MTTAADELSPGVPRSVPPSIAVAHMNEETLPLRRGVLRDREPDQEPPARARQPLTREQRERLYDVAGAGLMGAGVLGGVVLAFVYAGPAYGLGLLCVLAVLAGFLLGRI